MILNMTQHDATPEQIEAGVVNVPFRQELSVLLTFVELPTKKEIYSRVHKICDIAWALTPWRDRVRQSVMIGGAPFLMGPLAETLKARNFSVLFAFSERVSSEKIVNGQVVKVSEFRHLGFVQA